ncbi:hypothetical protein [Natroniella sp. ANB-PHB2]|uniref:hypothetical protein n=1 Tax=Natroniella sp. ANB-PHB2 TaxID=3384444 RepID=UPI0038D42AFE
MEDKEEVKEVEKYAHYHNETGQLLGLYTADNYDKEDVPQPNILLVEDNWKFLHENQHTHIINVDTKEIEEIIKTEEEIRLKEIEKELRNLQSEYNQLEEDYSALSFNGADEEELEEVRQEGEKVLDEIAELNQEKYELEEQMESDSDE